MKGPIRTRPGEPPVPVDVVERHRVAEEATLPPPSLSPPPSPNRRRVHAPKQSRRQTALRTTQRHLARAERPTPAAADQQSLPDAARRDRSAKHTTSFYLPTTISKKCAAPRQRLCHGGSKDPTHPAHPAHRGAASARRGFLGRRNVEEGCVIHYSLSLALRDVRHSA